MNAFLVNICSNIWRRLRDLLKSNQMQKLSLKMRVNSNEMPKVYPWKLLSLKIRVKVKKEKTDIIHAVRLEKLDSILLFFFRILATRQHAVMQTVTHTHTHTNTHTNFYKQRKMRAVAKGQVCIADLPKRRKYVDAKIRMHGIGLIKTKFVTDCIWTLALIQRTWSSRRRNENRKLEFVDNVRPSRVDSSAPFSVRWAVGIRQPVIPGIRQRVMAVIHVRTRSPLALVIAVGHVLTFACRFRPRSTASRRSVRAHHLLTSGYHECASDETVYCSTERSARGRESGTRTIFAVARNIRSAHYFAQTGLRTGDVSAFCQVNKRCRLGWLVYTSEFVTKNNL